MRSNTDSVSSSRESANSTSGRKVRKRLRKQIDKDQDGYKSKNPDNLRRLPGNRGRDDHEESKSPVGTPKAHRKRRSAFEVASDSNNGFASDENSSRHSPHRRSSNYTGTEVIEESRNTSRGSAKSKHLKLKVKKIDDEGVGNFFKIFCKLEAYSSFL